MSHWGLRHIRGTTPKHDPNTPNPSEHISFPRLRLPGELDRAVRDKDPVLILKAGHSAVLTDAPEFDAFGEKLVCRLSGTANWDLDDEINSGWGWSVAFKNYHSATAPPTRERKYENRRWGMLVF
jgi:hypothetical protein